MNNVYVIEKERRFGAPDSRTDKQERRRNDSLLEENLRECIHVQQWEYDNLTKLIDSKETKKFGVIKISFGVFAVISGMMAAIATFLAKYGDTPAREAIEYALSVSMVILMAGANLMNLTVIRYIVSIKSDVMLAMRQLNCVRQGLHGLLYTLLHRHSPNDKFEMDKGLPKSGEIGLYYYYVGRHIKYPFNNELLRSQYLKKNGDNDYRGYDYKALYRSADLFAICTIISFTFCLTSAPIILFFYKYYSNKNDFLSGVLLTATIFLGIIFAYIIARIIRTFFGMVTQPLIPDGKEKQTPS